MLSDAEERNLAEIETGLRQDDPAFVQRFADAAGKGAEETWLGMTRHVWFVIFAVAASVAWLLENTAMAVVAMTAFAVGITLWSLSDRTTVNPPQDPR